MILICIIEMRKVIMTRQSSQDLHFSPHNYTNYKKKIQQISSSLVQNQKTLNQKALTFGFGITFTATCSPLLSPFLNLTVGVYPKWARPNSSPKLVSKTTPPPSALLYSGIVAEFCFTEPCRLERADLMCLPETEKQTFVCRISRVFLEKDLSTGSRLTFL